MARPTFQPEVIRTPDGNIHFDYYRRRAETAHRQATQAAFSSVLRWLGRR